jgi:hypothetical protein
MLTIIKPVNKCLIIISIVFGTVSASLAQAQVIADRIVVSINNIPYSQLHIERYMNVRESLRDQISGSLPVQQSNWELATQTFVQEMMIHQDATKSSGFRPTKEAIQKLRFKSEKNVAESESFKQAFDRLGLRRTELETEILKIATVENYRRGKRSLDTDPKESSNNWEQDLSTRSIVRYMNNAKSWIKIEPRS